MALEVARRVVEETGELVEAPPAFGVVRIPAKPPGRCVERTCEFCGAVFLARVGNVARGWGRFCCRAHAASSRRGMASGRWRGGEMHLANGRVMVKRPEHGHANRYGYVLRYV